ncbi:MAG: Flp pilus assembly protein CpaB [Acetobacterales bacterium]
MLRRIALIALALTVAGGTMVLARNWLSAERAALLARIDSQKPKPVPAPTEKVLVAAADIPVGTLLQPRHLKWQPWPKGALADAYVTEEEKQLEDFVGVVGRSGLLTGQPITDRLVVRPGDRGFLAAVLTPGMRAVTVPVNATSGIAGFVFPGDRVDLILTHAVQNGDRDSRARRASETVLNDVRVIAVDQKIDDQGGQAEVARTATLEVTPKQAEMVAMLTDLGRLSLSLRSIVGEDLAEGGDTDGLLPRPPRRERTLTLDSEVSILLAPPPNRRNTRTVSVMRGEETQDMVFQRR